MSLRDRVVEFRRVPSAELLDNDKNWRTHPYAQQKALTELLDQVGIAGALTAYRSARNGGLLTLIDGHERRGSHQADWPVLILDVDDDEADLLLATLDPLASMAGHDDEALNGLLDTLTVGTPGLHDLLESLKIEPEDPARQNAPSDEEQVVVIVASMSAWQEIADRVGTSDLISQPVPTTAIDLMKTAVARLREEFDDSTLPEWKAVELIVADWLAGASSGSSDSPDDADVG